MSERISRRVGAITESATLAVDAKAKALKAPASRSSASVPASPTSPRRPTSSRPRSPRAATRSTTATRRPAGLPELRRPSPPRRCATPGWTTTAGQVLVTNGGKHAVYNTFEALLNPGDEVLLPAPYWTTYPEPIALAGATPVVIPTDVASGFKVTIEQLEAAYTPRTKALVFVSPSNPTGAVYSRERDRGDRPLGARAGHLGHHRRDLRAPRLRRSRVPLDRHARARVGRSRRDPQRRGQDVRHDRLARRLDDRPARPHQGRHQPADRTARPTSRNVVAGRGARRGHRRPHRGARDARRVRPSPAATCTQLLNTIDGVYCLEPEGAFYAFPSFEGVLGRTINGRKIATSTTELADDHPRRGQGGGRARRGVRRAGLLPVLVRARRRRPRRGRQRIADLLGRQVAR